MRMSVQEQSRTQRRTRVVWMYTMLACSSPGNRVVVRAAETADFGQFGATETADFGINMSCLIHLVSFPWFWVFAELGTCN